MRARIPHVAAAARLLVAAALVASVSTSGPTRADVPPPSAEGAGVPPEVLHAEGHGEPTDEELIEIARELAALERREPAPEGAEGHVEASDDGPPPPPPWSVEAVVGHSRSLSMGRANRGLLRRAVPLPRDPSVSVKSSSRDQHYGTAELVTLIVASARRVAEAFPGSRLLVGDLSRRGGGRIRPHRSHRSGRDADIGFYLVDARGRGLPLAPSFLFMNDALRALRHGEVYGFDVARNWTLVRALVSHPEVHPQYIFVARPQIAALLAEGRRQVATARGEERAATLEALHRAARVMTQPRGSPHRSHFHVRIFCARDDHPTCEDDPPMYPWVRGRQSATESETTDVLGPSETVGDDDAGDAPPVDVEP